MKRRENEKRSGIDGVEGEWGLIYGLLWGGCCISHSTLTMPQNLKMASASQSTGTTDLWDPPPTLSFLSNHILSCHFLIIIKPFYHNQLSYFILL